MKKDIREYLNIKTLLLVLLVALVIFIPAWGNRRYMNIAILVLMYIGLGESWNLLSGMSGLFSIAHALFFGLGVYGMTIGMTKLGLPVVGGILLGLAANLVMALIVGFVGSKLSGLYFTMALIALHAIIYTLAGQLSFTGYALGLSMPREYLMSRHALYFLVLGLAALMMLIFVWVRKSRIGTNFVALKENPDLAVSLGLQHPRLAHPGGDYQRHDGLYHGRVLRLLHDGKHPRGVRLHHLAAHHHGLHGGRPGQVSGARSWAAG